MDGNIDEGIAQWLERQRPGDIWDNVLLASFIKTEDGTGGLAPSNPSELREHLKAVEAHFVRHPELLKGVEFKKNGPHGRMLRKSVYGGLFRYWLENGTTTQEVADYVAELFAFDWLRPDGDPIITETISEGLLLGGVFCSENTDAENEVLQGIGKFFKDGNVSCPPSLKVYLGLVCGYLKKSRDGWPFVADGVNGVRPSDVAHGVLCFLNSVKLKKVLFISEVSAGLAPADADGLLYQNWSETIAAATPESAFLLDKFSPGACHIYIMTVAVILKLPEIWPEVERLGAYENVTGLLQKLNRPDARREDYICLDREWDRLKTMLSVARKTVFLQLD